MKYLLGFVIGLLGGAIAAAALIYFNPLTRGQALPAQDAGQVYAYSLAAADSWITTHDRSLGFGVNPDDVPLLWESGIRRTLLTALPLRVEAGGIAAAATRISVPSPKTELLREGLLVDDYWLISVPGQGSVFVHALDNLWPLLRDTVVRVDWLGREWTDPAVYGPTQGPTAAGAEIMGLSGSFAGTAGRARDRLTLASYTGRPSLETIEGALLVELADDAD